MIYQPNKRQRPIERRTLHIYFPTDLPTGDMIITIEQLDGTVLRKLVVHELQVRDLLHMNRVVVTYAKPSGRA